MATPETRYARTTDGTHVAYQVTGGGPVDILVMRSWHSNLDNEWTDPVVAGIYRRLGSMGRVIMLDRRGTGLSDRIDPARLPTLEDRIDDIRAVMAAIGSDRVILVGLGPGGAVCSAFAAMRPEATVGLVLYGATFGVPLMGDLDAWIAEIREGWATTAAAQELAERIAPSRAGDAAFVEWMRRDMELSGDVEDAVAQARINRETDLSGVLPAIHVPTLVVWREGGMTEVSRRAAQAIPGAIGIELPGRDHALISGDWRRALGEIEDFIERVTGEESEADRVLATVMFTDVVGSTQHAADIGDRAWRELMDRHHATVRSQLAHYRGREIDTAGDGFFVAFDGPARAIRGAWAIRHRVREHGLELKIGLHAGECERVGTGLRGVAVHIGARIGALAEGGQILVSSTVRDLVAGSGIGFEDAGRHALKGVPEEWQLYRVASV